MKVHEYLTAYEIAKKNRIALDPQIDAGRLPYDQWYRLMNAFMSAATEGKGGNAEIAQSQTEKRWLDDRKPYYTVYPVAAEALSKVPLDVTCETVKLPLPAMLIRFGVDKEPLCHDTKLRSMLLGSLPVNWAVEGKYSHHPGLTVWMDMGAIDVPLSEELGFPMPIYHYCQFPLVPGMKVDEVVEDVSHKDFNANLAIQHALRYAIGVCLLAHDPSIIKPDVLAADREKYERTLDEALAEKARRRGKVGWLVGADWEVIPHYRRPHLGLRWTGEGRKIPKIVPVKGAVVHRTKLTEVPQGRIDDEPGRDEVPDSSDRQGVHREV